MADLALVDLLSLPGDFQRLDYDEEEEILSHHQRIPFSNLTNLPPDHNRPDGRGDNKPLWEAIECVSDNLHQENPGLKLEEGLDIDCREEVVSTRGHPGRSQMGSNNFLSPRPKEAPPRSFTIPPVTPTKPGLENIDPLTPTTNLKILSSVVSPEIRKQNEKKERLFKELLAVTWDDRLNQHSAPSLEQPEMQENVAPGTVKENSRKAKSLGLLCERFLERYQRNDNGSLEDGPQEISLDIISKDLNVERRRIYDIINVLESVDMVSRRAKNRYIWHGQGNLTEVLKKLKYLGAQYKYGDQLETLKQQEKDKEVGVKGECITGVHHLSDPLNKLPITEEEGKREKSLGVMSQKFIMLFLQPVDRTITLETAARVLYGEHCEDITDNPKFKTKVRRLYDIANVLGSLKLIRKVYIQEVRGRKPAFEWIGPSPDITGYKPDNLQTLFTASLEKKPTPTEASRNRKRSQKGKSPRVGWGRHHSFNALPQGRLMEPREPRSLPSSPGKQPPTPITDSSEFQHELIALCSKYPGQMQQFLTTPPAGSIEPPATARKLLMPSPSTATIFQEQSTEGAINCMKPGVEERVVDGMSSAHPRLNTFFVQRYLPILTPDTLLQLQQAQGSPSCGSAGGKQTGGQPLLEGSPMPGTSTNSLIVGSQNGALVNRSLTQSGADLATSSFGEQLGDSPVVGQHGVFLNTSIVQSVPSKAITSAGKLPRNLVLVSPMPGMGGTPVIHDGALTNGLVLKSAPEMATTATGLSAVSSQTGTTVSPVVTNTVGHGAHQGNTRVHPGANTIICSGVRNAKRMSPQQNEYQAVMKQLKVAHQPGGLMMTGVSPSPESSREHSPTGDCATTDSSTGEVNPPRLDQNVVRCIAEMNNGWYDPIVCTPSAARPKKRHKHGSKHVKKDKAKKAKNRERHTKMQVQASDVTPSLGGQGIDHVRRQLVPPHSVSTPQQSSLRSPSLSRSDYMEATPPSSQEYDAYKQKRRLFKSHRSKAQSARPEGRKSRQEQDEKSYSPVGVEATDILPLAWLPRDTPTPASSLMGIQEFDQMLRNNIGSPLMSFLPSRSRDSSPLGIPLHSLPNFVCHTQQRHVSVLPNPTPLPLTSLMTSVDISLATSEGSCWPMVVPVSFPILVSGHCPVGAEQDSVGRRIRPDASNGYRTAFEFVSKPAEQAV